MLNEKEELKSKVIEFRSKAKELNRMANRLEDVVKDEMEADPKSADISNISASNKRGWIKCQICPLKHRAKHPHIKEMKRRHLKAA